MQETEDHSEAEEPSSTTSSTVVGSYLDAARSLPLHHFRPVQIVSACTASDGVEDAGLSIVDSQSQGTVAHHEVESVVSSWLDDDECFVAAVQNDSLHKTPAGLSVGEPAPAPQGNKKTFAMSKERNVSKRQSRQRQKPTTPTVSSNISGGRFDALATESTKRRW
jgi:hypothetical protein